MTTMRLALDLALVLSVWWLMVQVRDLKKR